MSESSCCAAELYVSCFSVMYVLVCTCTCVWTALSDFCDREVWNKGPHIEKNTGISIALSSNVYQV